MDSEKWLFEKGCFLGNWNDDEVFQKTPVPAETFNKLQNKDLDTLLSELEEIKHHIEDVRQRQWQLAQLIEYHNNNFARE